MKMAEMESSMEHMRADLSRAREQGFVPDYDDSLSPMATNRPYTQNNLPNNQSFMGSEEAVSSLLTLKQSGGAYGPRFARELEGVGLAQNDIDHLFGEFWDSYHIYLPFLNPNQSPTAYHEQSRLLFWVIISIGARHFHQDPTLLTALSAPLSRLLWTTLGEVPTSHYVVKALCLLCTWPLPTSTTTSDPTHVLGGVMMKAATGIGLHRPNHTQDFSRVSVELDKEQLHDRVTTWAVCNIVAQNLGTGYGQPASTLYDWTLAVRPGEDGPFRLSPELEARLEIEQLCDKISKNMYSNASDPRGVAGDEMRANFVRTFRRDYNTLQSSILSKHNLSPIVNLHLKAAGLHLHLSTLFDSSSTSEYTLDLMRLWQAATAFLEVVFNLDSNPQEGQPSKHTLLSVTNYILQMVFAACFTLLRMLGSSFSSQIDANRGKTMFQQAIHVIRSMSVINYDLPFKLAELMVQMYHGNKVDTNNQQNNGDDTESTMDSKLQLKVRCRMSMSLVFDSIWRWREEFEARGKSLDSKLKIDSLRDICHIKFGAAHSDFVLREFYRQGGARGFTDCPITQKPLSHRFTGGPHHLMDPVVLPNWCKALYESRPLKRPPRMSPVPFHTWTFVKDWKLRRRAGQLLPMPVIPEEESLHGDDHHGFDDGLFNQLPFRPHNKDFMPPPFGDNFDFEFEFEVPQGTESVYDSFADDMNAFIENTDPQF